MAKKKAAARQTRVGLWIDHRKVLLVSVTAKGEEVGVVVSKVEKQLRRTGDSPLRGSYESLAVPADNARQRALTAHLNAYYDAVISNIRDAGAILIIGPGEAKNELKKRLKQAKLGDHIVGVETADKMTPRQIEAKVRRHFSALD